MKVKSSFITNSSSSSFVVWGLEMSDFEFSDDILLKIYWDTYNRLNKLKGQNQLPSWQNDAYHQLKGMTTDEERLEWANDMDTSEKLEYLLEGTGLEYGSTDGFTGIGIRPLSLEKTHPEMPIGQVREFVAKEISQKLGMNVTKKDVSYIEEVWYN